ncbi:1-aminocyclopropane-1-carboxylate deaminase/D-cysteine desulfhydrase [Pseudomonas sp. NyZ201]|uniref:1-aminocyclopropane-1-carboxylate deaminase/D-cysteine desulfhydrase n=1 Tax=Pseudomonas sp. NyZ201 TaxID=3409857 RepID=UPI003CF80D17
MLNLPQAPLQRVSFSWLTDAGIELAILRLDQIDPLVSGNKWFKLLEHLRLARQNQAPGLISLGGNHSNHLHALAAAGQRFGFKTAGLLRGNPQDTPTIRDLQAFGMHLHWLGYGGYRARNEPGFWAPWQARYPGWHCIPEGGGGELGEKGCALIVEQARAQLANIGWDDYDAWWLAAGTGTTAAGLIAAEAGARPVHAAMAVPKGYGVEHVLSHHLHDASRGGFAKVDPELLAFIDACERESAIPLEPVYTGKALLALKEKAGCFEPGTRLIFVHTGGLQGRRGFA